jgi:hypothetical protein
MSAKSESCQSACSALLMGRELANADVNKAFWKNLLDVNSRSHKCHGCDRHIPATDAKQFETYVCAFRCSSHM